MVLSSVFLVAAAGAPGTRDADIDAYFQPYVETNNFSGSVLAWKPGSTDAPIFLKSYGYADAAHGIPNTPTTKFHIASLSILFTSTAVLRLIDQGRLSFDTRVSDIVPGVTNGDTITIRNLLEQNSGMADANDLPNYDALLAAHQTPQSLVDAIKGVKPVHPPGGKSDDEEHSAQNLLALIIERKTGLPFREAMKAEVFDPFDMHDSGVDDDGPISGALAQGQIVSGTFGLKPSPAIHWSAKSGNGSAYSTVLDEQKWLGGIINHKLSERSTKALFESSQGYGWYRDKSALFEQNVLFSNGRAPGFSSRMLYLPASDLCIVALTNIENEASPDIVRQLALKLLGKPYSPFTYNRIPNAVVGHPAGDFRFGADFYRASATLTLVSNNDEVVLEWPGGPNAPLLPTAPDHFMDRYYWTEVVLDRGSDGSINELRYGRFTGVRVPHP